MAKMKETATIYSAETGAITVVSRQGRTEIPLALRRKYQIGPEAKLRWIDAGQTWIVVPLSRDPIKAARGILKGKKTSVSAYLAVKREELVEEEARLRSG